MEATTTSDGQLLITGAGGDQPLIMSAEDAAQFLAQAGLQLADIGDSERIIIGDARQDQQEVTITSQESKPYFQSYYIILEMYFYKGQFQC